ncbi:TPA: hypothetical protein DCZ36_03470 [Candidatus Gracilibacteria bacterium]|nr:hypothetical protein [Candidatus Gracilibacteria bacterium]
MSDISETSPTIHELLDAICDEEKQTETISMTVENISRTSSQIIDNLMNSSLEESAFHEEYLKTEQIICREIREYKQGFSKRNNGDIDYDKLEKEMRKDPEWVKKFDFLGYESDLISILISGEPMEGMEPMHYPKI